MLGKMISQILLLFLIKLVSKVESSLEKTVKNADLVIIDKRRSKANKSEVMNIIGDVENKNCIMIDDMVDTAGTLCHAADKLKECGATSVRAYITHPVLSGPAVQRITDSAIDELRRN